MTTTQGPRQSTPDGAAHLSAELEDAGRAFAIAAMRSILNSGHDWLRVFDDLSDLQDKLTIAARTVGEERACWLAEHREPNEKVSELTRRVGRLSASRIGDLLELAEALRGDHNGR